jgi:hypothetical protein
MTHGEAAHERGTHNMFTGYRPSPALQVSQHRQRGLARAGRRQEQPARLRLHPQPAQPLRGVRLPQLRLRPVQPGQRPRRQAGSRCATSTCPATSRPSASSKRKRMLAKVDAHFRAVEKSDASTPWTPSTSAPTADQLSRGPRGLQPGRRAGCNLRDEYGRNASGQRMLLARRLVESGVRFVSMTAGWWDHHERIVEGIRQPAQPGPGIRRAHPRPGTPRACSTRPWSW